MPLTPVAGNQRLRAFQLGIESTFKTQVAATRRVPFTFDPDVNPNTTFPTADTGTLSMGIAPYQTGTDITGSATGQLFSNDCPALFAASIMGGISATTPSGTARQWSFTPADKTIDVFDTFTGEWFDDATADAWAGTGGVINDWTLDYPQDQGPINLTANWRFAKKVYPATPTGSLNVDLNPTPLFMADTELYLNDTAAAIGTTKISDALYSANISYNNNLDIKRFANGSNTRFEVANYGRGPRVVTFSITLAKTSAPIAEVVKWIAASPSERFLELKTTSTVNASTAPNVPHSLSIRIPGFWLTRADTLINTNTGFTLQGQNVYDSTLLYPFKVVTVGTMSTVLAP